MTQEETQRAAEESAVKMINKVFASMFTSPAFKYWSSEKKDKYFYTKEKINHNGNPRYVAGIYRFLKTKKQWKLIKRVGFAKKKKAIDWAYSAYKERK